MRGYISVKFCRPTTAAISTFYASNRSRRCRDERHTRMAYFLQQLINGLTLGSIYGLIAIGYTMVYGIIGMINFAHGEIYMIGAFISIIAFVVLGFAGVSYVPLTIVLVLATTMGFTAIYGWTVERIAYRPLRGSFRLAPLISAIGASIFLQNYVQILQGARGKPMPPLVRGRTDCPSGARPGIEGQFIGAGALVTEEFWKLAGSAGKGTLMTFAPDPRNLPAAKAIVDKFLAERYNPGGLHSLHLCGEPGLCRSGG